jgi:hypothetical protein
MKELRITHYTMRCLYDEYRHVAKTECLSALFLFEDVGFLDWLSEIVGEIVSVDQFEYKGNWILKIRLCRCGATLHHLPDNNSNKSHVHTSD